MVYGSIYGAARGFYNEGVFNPDYATPSAALDMVTEGLEIDQKFFDLFVEHDFLEVAACDNVALESTLMAVDESFLGDVWGKIREFLKKIKDKIVSIVKAATVKIGAFFKKDNEALISKYSAQFDAADKSNITIKGFMIYKDGHKEDLSVDKFKAAFDDIGVGKLWDGNNAKQKIKELEKFQKDNSTLKLLKRVFPSSCVSDSGKVDWKRCFFRDPKDVKASDPGIAAYIKTTLTDYQTEIQDIKDLEKDMLDEVDELDKQAKESQDKVMELIDDSSKKSEDQKSVENKKASVAKDICSSLNTVFAKLCSAAIEVSKFDMKQCRAAYIKIASMGAPNVRKESAELLEAIIDSDNYEVDSFFDQYSYDYDELTA